MIITFDEEVDMDEPVFSRTEFNQMRDDLYEQCEENMSKGFKRGFFYGLMFSAIVGTLFAASIDIVKYFLNK